MVAELTVTTAAWDRAAKANNAAAVKVAEREKILARISSSNWLK
jgi:hypothetical protein